MTMLALDGSDITKQSAAPAAAPVASMRDPRLDFYRGLAMFIILIAHTPGNFLTLWIPARFGFSDATEIFVFCSGMASAIAFGKVFAERGWWLGTARVAFRVWQVYWAHIGLFLAIATMMAFIDSFGIFDKSYVGSLNLTKFFNDPAPQLIGLMTLTYVPNYFDILPMYLVILAMMPVVVGLHRIQPLIAACFVAGVWMLTQERALAGLGLDHIALELPAEPWSSREWFFNPFGWQLVFFTGFAFMRGWLPRPPVDKRLIWLAIAIVVLTVPLAYFRILNAVPELKPIRDELKFLTTKTDFGLLRYVHFLALAYLGWVVAGEHGSRLRAVGSGMAAILWQRVLNVILKVGQQSLAVFIVSMVAARLIGFGFDQVGRNFATVWIGNLMGFALLIAVAYGVGWFKSHPWRKKRV